VLRYFAKRDYNQNYYLKGLLLSKSFSPYGNPYFFTVVKVLDNLGFKLNIQHKKTA